MSANKLKLILAILACLSSINANANITSLDDLNWLYSRYQLGLEGPELSPTIFDSGSDYQFSPPISSSAAHNINANKAYSGTAQSNSASGSVVISNPDSIVMQASSSASSVGGVSGSNFVRSNIDMRTGFQLTSNQRFYKVDYSMLTDTSIINDNLDQVNFPGIYAGFTAIDSSIGYNETFYIFGYNGLQSTDPMYSAWSPTMTTNYSNSGTFYIPNNGSTGTMTFDFWMFASTAVSGTSSVATNGLFSINVSSVPEPETYAMFLIGLGLLGFAASKKNKLKDKRLFFNSLKIAAFSENAVVAA